MMNKRITQGIIACTLAVRHQLLKNVSIFFLFLLSFCSLESKRSTVDLEGRLAGFFAKSETFKEVYGDVGASYQLEAALRLPQNLKWWNNFSYMGKQGHSVPLRVDTCLTVFSVSSGLKYLIWFSENANIYLGVGPVYSWMKEKNDSEFIRRTNKRDGAGVLFKSGITRVQNHLILSLFVDYQLQKLRKRGSIGSRKIDLSGFYLGFSIGGGF